MPSPPQYVSSMNFQEEVRAHRDLDDFLAQSSILLEEDAATLEEVLKHMLTRMMDEGGEAFDVDAVMESLFTDASGLDANGRAFGRKFMNMC